MEDLKACCLCEHRCGVDRLAGETGVCRVGAPVVASRTLHPAPPESYTIFMAGCNFRCLSCQNWSISQFPDNDMPIEGPVDPRALALESVEWLNSAAGRMMGADRIFFSGGEPSIHLPYVEEVVAEARRLHPGCKVNFDTNGFMTEASLRRILDFATSITFDIKAFFDHTHRAITGAPVGPVLRNAKLVAGEAPGQLWEFRVVAIPQVNEADIAPICRFLAGISRDLPVCFLAFRPNYALEEHPGATLELMRRCLALADEAGLKNAVWAGRTGVSGSPAPIRGEAGVAYEGSGAGLAGSYALSRGCRTHPRDCRRCPASDSCSVKGYRPGRSC